MFRKVIVLSVLSLLAVRSDGVSSWLQGKTYEIDSTEQFFENESSKCTKAGKACNNCTEPILCIAVPGGFVIESLGKCEKGSFCRDEVGCIKEYNPTCAGNVFECSDVGTYPDPYDCTQYHVCVRSNETLKLYSDRCKDGYKYDPDTTLCKIKPGAKCPFNTPQCKNLGDSDAIKSLSSYFYICRSATLLDDGAKITYPFLYRCEHGESYRNGVCK